MVKEEISVNPKKFGKIEEVSIGDFVNNILPKSTNIELMVANNHQNNLMSLVSPQDREAPSMFKWHTKRNPFFNDISFSQV